MSSELKPVKVGVMQVDAMFQAWLKPRGKDFPYKVVRRPVRSKTPRWSKTGKEYCFAGITTDLYFSVQTNTLRTHFDLAGIYYDTLHDMEVDPAISADGRFTCECCARNFRDPEMKRKYPGTKPEKYFKTLQDLYADHCFKKLLRWAKRAIRKNNIIIYGGDIEGPHIALVAPMQAIRYFDGPYQVQRLTI